MRLLLFATIVLGNLVHQGDAGFWDWLLRPLARDYLPGYTEEVHYYLEDAIGTAQTMADFISTEMYFVALFKYREHAIYEDGRATNLTGFEADKLYTRVMLSDVVPSVGGELKFIADIQPGSNGTKYWDSMAVIYFPNSLAFGVMTAMPKFKQLIVHKKAGLEDHVIFSCEAIQGSSMHAASGVEGANGVPVATIDFIQYKSIAKYQEGDPDAANFRTGREAVDIYNDIAVPSEMEYGMSTAMRLQVKHSLVQTDYEFDEVRIDTYPSHTDLLAAKSDISLEQASHHFVAGVQDELLLEGSPIFVNALGGNAYIGYYDACKNVENFRSTMLKDGEVDITSYCPDGSNEAETTVDVYAATAGPSDIVGATTAPSEEATTVGTDAAATIAPTSGFMEY